MVFLNSVSSICEKLKENKVIVKWKFTPYLVQDEINAINHCTIFDLKKKARATGKLRLRQYY